MIEKELEKTISAVERSDAMALRHISQDASRLAVTEQEKDVVGLAVVAYALNKLYSKAHFTDKHGGIQAELLTSLRAGDFNSTLAAIEKFDDQHGLFHGNLVGKARIKVGARLYSHGISLSTAANLTGVGSSDLQDYVGGTKADYPSRTLSVRDRIRVAKQVFKE